MLNKLPSIFDKVFVINLKRRKDRVIRVLWRLSLIGIPAEIVEAFDGKDEEVMKEWKKTPMNISAGEYAYVKTWHSLLKRAISDKSINKLLFFDDDVLFCLDFQERLKNLKISPTEWRILYLGASQHATTVDWDEAKKQGWFYPVRTAGSFAVGLDRSVFKRCIELIEASKFNKVLDSGILIRLVAENEGHAKVIYPHLCIATVSESDLRENRDQNEMAIKCHWGNLLKYQQDETPYLLVILEIVTIVSPQEFCKYLDNIASQTYENFSIQLQWLIHEHNYQMEIEESIERWKRTIPWRYPLFHHNCGIIHTQDSELKQHHDIVLNIMMGDQRYTDHTRFELEVIEFLKNFISNSI